MAVFSQANADMRVKRSLYLVVLKKGVPSPLAGRTPGMLADWDQVLRETRAAASRAARVLRVGFMSSAANEATQQIIAAFGRRRAGWRVDMQQARWSDPTAGLASGDVDAALLRLPFPGQDEMRIEVRWRSGKRSVVQGVRANREYEIDEAGATGMWKERTPFATFLTVPQKGPSPRRILTAMLMV